MYGSKLIKISNRQNKLIKVNNFDATFLFFMKYDTPTLNMRPPSTGPRGSRLNKPTPMFITHNQNSKSATYMKDYFDAEMCCKGVEALCPSASYLYTPQPLPEYLKGVKCPNTPENSPNGVWKSDTRLELNEIALFDAPAHTSLNIIKTGTCVDYSFSLTTLLRKVGYKSDEIYTVEAYNHAYNLVKLPFDNKYTLVDTTGNNDPAIIFGHVPLGYDYCENIKTCYNDNGEALCPSFDNIYGCENAKQSIVKQGKVIGFRTNEIINKIVELVRVELER